MKEVINNISRLLCTLLLIFSMFSVVNVLASEVIFQITKIEVKEKSDKVTVNDVSLSGGTITNDIVFTDEDDYITYNITIKNNTEDDYTVKSISDNNTSTYLKYTYDDLSNVKIESGKEKTFNMTITYIQETTDLTISDQSVSLTLTYEKEDATTGTETITNPKTGDNITLYIILGLVSVTGLVITSSSKKHLSKSLMVVAVASLVLIPIGVKANSDKFIIKFNNTIKEKEYIVTFNTNGGSTIEPLKVVKGGKVTRPTTDPTKENKEFNNWYTTSEVSTLFDFENTTITKDTEIFAKWEEISRGPTLILPTENETHKGIAYLNPTDLTDTCDATNSISDSVANTGCMKFYIFDDSGSTYKMILYRNTTAYVAWNSDENNSNSVMREVQEQLEADTYGWSGTPRLITADEVASIIGSTVWSSSTALQNGGMFFGSKSMTNYSNQSDSNKAIQRSYNWLFDYTNDCDSYGCSIPDSSTKGYWTSTPLANDEYYCWMVFRTGYLGNQDATIDDLLGVRPVITLEKSVFSSQSN